MLVGSLFVFDGTGFAENRVREGREAGNGAVNADSVSRDGGLSKRHVRWSW